MRGAHTLLILLAVGIAGVLYFTTAASGHTRRTAGSNAVIAAAGAYTADVAFLGISDFRRLAFDVVQHGNAGVTGEVQNHNPVSGVDWVMAVNCLALRGNQAIVGGTIVQSSDTTQIQIGEAGAMVIEDNPDAISFFDFNPGNNPPVTCDNLLALVGEPSMSAFLADATPLHQRAVVTIGDS